MSSSDEFRRTCRSVVEDVVEHAGAWFSEVAVEAAGQPGEYLHCVIQPGDIEVWIDEDTAEYAVGMETVRFELASYRRAKDMIGEFGTALAEELTKAVAGIH